MIYFNINSNIYSLVGKNILNRLIRISEKSFFTGSYTGLDDLELYGSFEGFLVIKNLFLKKTGVFRGHISAENIIVEGEISANIETENLHLRETGIIDGDVFYRNIIIDLGGILKSQMVQNISKIDNLIKLTKN